MRRIDLIYRAERFRFVGHSDATCYRPWGGPGAPAGRRGGEVSLTRHALAREITAALVFKAVVLGLLYLAFFAPHHRTAITPERAAARLLSDGTNERGP